MTRVAGMWVIAAAAATVGCGTTGPPASPVPATAVATFRLARVAAADGPPAEVAPAHDAAQVTLLLAGDPVPVDELTAEIGQLGALDDARRWPVDEPRPEDSGVLGRVVVPIYAVPAGEHVLTLWRGDAEVLAHYRFRVP